MDDDGRIAVLLPHGVLFRGSSEYTIRKYLIDTLNVVDAIIGLAPNLFHGTSIPVTCIICKRKRNGNSGNILFIDASKEFVPGKNQNSMSEDNIQRIVDAYVARKDENKFAHVTTLDEIRQNDFNLNIPRYVDTFEEEEQIDISAKTAQLKELDAKIAENDKIVSDFFKELGLEI